MLPWCAVVVRCRVEEEVGAGGCSGPLGASRGLSGGSGGVAGLPGGKW